MKRPFHFLLRLFTGLWACLILASFSVSALSGSPEKHKDNPVNIADTFPVPTGNKRMVFYVQRTHNINTIVYELNYNGDSTLNATTPIHPYWMRYADNGGAQELSYIQRQYAYGVVSELIDKEKQTFKINFVSYKKRDIFLIRSKTDKTYAAYITINGKLVRLERVFVKIEGGSFWVPHITYVEITGKDVNGKTVSEKIIP